MEPALFEILDQLLSEIDAVLVGRGIPLAERPLNAALLLVQSNVLKISTDGGKSQYIYDGTAAFTATEWFGSLYGKVEEWYGNRYGSALSHTGPDTFTSVILIFGTPFRLEVPCCLSRPASTDQAVWISFPDHIEQDEVVLDWLVNPPNLKIMPPAVLNSTIADIKNVAGHLRFLHSNLLGVKADKAVDGLIHGITSHLRHAAGLILTMKDAEMQNCYWELQMSIECSLKSLLYKKKGIYPTVHSLEDLCAEASALGMSFDTKRLAIFPGSKEVINRRYGQGTSERVTNAFSAYLLTLELAKSAVSAIPRINLGNASFKIGQPPWQAQSA